MENEQLELLKRIDRRTRINTVIIIVILAIIVSCAAFAFYYAHSLSSAVDQFVGEYNRLKTAADSFDLEGIGTLLSDIQSVDFARLSEAAASIDVDALDGAIEQLSSIDVDALNEAIVTLNKLGSTFGKLFG